MRGHSLGETGKVIMECFTGGNEQDEVCLHKEKNIGDILIVEVPSIIVGELGLLLFILLVAVIIVNTITGTSQLPCFHLQLFFKPVIELSPCIKISLRFF
jgi:hypothetical protein